MKKSELDLSNLKNSFSTLKECYYDYTLQKDEKMKNTFLDYIKQKNENIYQRLLYKEV